MKIVDKLLLNFNTKNFPLTLHEIGRCLLKINKQIEALEYLQPVMKIYRQVSRTTQKFDQVRY